jgi:hypothetical protein
MHPTSFFGNYTPPEGNPHSYHLHSAVRPSSVYAAPALVKATIEAPPYRPGRPYFPPQPPHPEQNKLPGPVPHPGPTWPHYPPPFSPPENALVPAYSASAPPPEYSLHKLDADRCRCVSDDDEEYDEVEEEGPDGLRKVVMLILIGMNVLVWGMVFYYWIQDDLMGRLWAEVQAEGGVRFQI